MEGTGLIYKVLSGTASESEHKQVQDWVKQSDLNRLEFEDVQLLYKNTEDSNTAPDDFPKISNRIHRKIQGSKRKRAALLIISLGFLPLIATLFFFHPQHKKLTRFNQVTLAEVIKILEEDYELSIIVRQDELLHCRFTGTFYTREPVEIVKSLAKGLNLNIRMKAGSYEIGGKGCQ